MQIVRRVWNEGDVSYDGQFYRVDHSTCLPRPYRPGGPPLWFGGASPAAEQVAATEADVQLMWGEKLAMAEERIERLKRLATGADRFAPNPLEFGLRITVVVRETSDEAWEAARAKLGGWEGALDRRVEKNVT